MQIEFDTFKPKYSKDFTRLNLDWLETYFYVEPHDAEVLHKAYEYIINPGGHILVAKINDKVVGVVALMPVNDSVYELTKMAVDKAYRGQQVGQKLMQYCLEYARNKKIDTLILYSNRKLENAIYIYRKFGFIEQQLEQNNPYARADIKMSLKL